MRRTYIVAAAVFAYSVLCGPATASAQLAGGPVEAVGRVASLASGSIAGVVRDEAGSPLQGAVVSALGATPAVAVTDRTGRFLLQTLSPGPYLVRAQRTGFSASRAQIVDVRPSGRAASTIALQRTTTKLSASTVMAAGVASQPDAPASAPPAAPAATGLAGPAGDDPQDQADGEDSSELAWRLRHARRSILRDAALPDDMLADADSGEAGFFGRALGASARLGTSLFADAPVTGQFNLLTAGSFDTPLQLFATDSYASSVAYMSLGSAASASADWSVRGAFSQGQIASWILAGTYTTRAPGRHHYDVSMSYAAQRYNAANPGAVVSQMTSREGGTISAFDTLAVTPEVAVTYGTRYARYDYLADRNMMSPRAGVTIAPSGEPFRLSALVSHRGLAPGAEEFLAPADASVWMPSQRTFSALGDQPLLAERTNHFELGYEQDIARDTTLTFKAFRQHVQGQLVTVFGLETVGELGHYFTANAGDTEASAVSAGIRTTLGRRLHASAVYSMIDANWNRNSDPAYVLMMAPSAVRVARERFHDLAGTIETDVPETSTRLVLLYRVSNGFARPQGGRPSTDTRFDLQVHQSLPFMNFSNAQWEALFAVRNFFHEIAADQSIYDELLVVHPPKRVVGGLTLRF